MLNVDDLEAKNADLSAWQPPHGSGLSNFKPWLWLYTWTRTRRRPKSQHQLQTAYLDGLRGFAALIVYWHHHVLWAHKEETEIFENGFGYNNQYYFAALPGIRLFFSGGHLAVSIFFVLSGYVLAIKPLRLIEKNDASALAEHLGSAIFRRWLRLFLPVAAVTLVYTASWHFFGLWVDGAKPHDGWLHEIWGFYCEFKNFSFPFKDGGVPWLSYNVHLWSIPVEFKGSMVVFASLLAISRCSLNARLWCQVSLIVYFMYIADGWYCAMFVAGMLLSHLDLLAEVDKDGLPCFLTRLAPYRKIICHHFLALGIYLGGVPSANRDLNQLAHTRGWYLLSYLKPQAVFDYKWFYLFWAAVLLITSVSNIGWLKRFFETNACQYLGRVSYALYLVHGPVLWIFGDRLYTAVGFKGQSQIEHIPQWVDRFELPQTGPFGLEFAFLLPHVVLLPLTLCMADFVTRVVDRPSVQFAAWIYRKTLPAQGVAGKHANA
ncbi:Acyltransferase 3 [Metarhizium album ARSEF 1941]|uniref:Acyltransferase 3 n=1 Tax=Metarhizium album (strain ARSEF 1941) TaxID=1081103 RepID=A0A0B2WVX9_METAS|nr:Acyltransferase 3 [Metarhizium album ARSEF 1941]KHO00307.1 Acyltransferase 3 [Metarhizium album ARSEF 1941]